MNTKNVELNIDRIENGITVAYDRDGNRYVFAFPPVNVKEGDIISASINSNCEIIDFTVLQEETQRAKSSLKKQLATLFSNSERTKK